MGENILGFLTKGYVLWTGLAVAAVLILAWILRGAPIGQATAEAENENAPPAGYRNRIVAATVFGFLCLGAGGIVAIARGLAWAIPLFAVGFGLVFAMIRIGLRHRHSSPSLLRLATVADAMLNGALLAGFLIVANVLAFKYGGRALDFTGERTFTLADLSVKQLRGLNRPIKFIVIYGQGAQAASSRVNALLELFKAENPEMVRVETIRPYEDAAAFKPLADSLPELKMMAMSGGVLVEYGEGKDVERAVVNNADLFERERGAIDDRSQPKLNFNGEDALISAVVRLRQGKRLKVGFTSGHGEASLEPVPPPQPSITRFRNRLATLGLDPVVVNLLKEDVPRDLQLLVIAEPRSPFQATELRRLKTFTELGGKALVLLDSRTTSVESRSTAGLDDWLKTYNVAVERGLVFDAAEDYSFSGRVDIVRPFVGDSRHPIIDTLSGLPIYLPLVAPLTILGDPSRSDSSVANPNFATVPVLRSSPTSWKETDSPPNRFKGDKEPAGPFNLAVSAADRAPKNLGKEAETPRLVVFGGGLFLEDQTLLRISENNLDLALNAVSWLRAKPEQQGIAPRTHATSRLASSSVDNLKMVVIPTFMSIVVVVGIGLAAYFARRN